jgi:hypothetical protein
MYVCIHTHTHTHTYTHTHTHTQEQKQREHQDLLSQHQDLLSQHQACKERSLEQQEKLSLLQLRAAYADDVDAQMAEVCSKACQQLVKQLVKLRAAYADDVDAQMAEAHGLAFFFFSTASLFLLLCLDIGEREFGALANCCWMFSIYVHTLLYVGDGQLCICIYVHILEREAPPRP